MTDSFADDTGLVLQRGVFTGPRTEEDPALYTRVHSGPVDPDRFTLHLGDRAHADTDTYFGRFPAAYFQRWTHVKEVALRFRHRAEVAATAVVRASDAAGIERELAVAQLSGDGRVDLPIALDRFFDGGSVWVEFRSHGGTLAIDDLRWCAPAHSARRPVSIAICTFDRPHECLQVLESLSADPQVRDLLAAVHVVDQGTDRLSDQPGLAAVATAFAGRLYQVCQANLGGAGGFSRGMAEALRSGIGGDLVLMDDDIRCEPETVLRLHAFAQVTVTPSLVGAQMLNMMNPTELHVGAEYADLARLRAGRWAPGALHDADMTTLRQDRRVDAGYSGWWTCLVPTEVISAVGYALPMFFQWDDIEYGLRTRSAGYPTITLPGAAVWHADFGWKDKDDWAKYFSMRNSLIAAAVHGHIDPKPLGTLIAREIAQYIAAMQYGLAHTALRGVEDFLTGPTVLADGGTAALAAIRADRRAYPETVTRPIYRTPDLPATAAELQFAGPRPDKDRFDLVLAKRMAGQFLGRTRPAVAAIPHADAHWWHVSLFGTAVVTDAAQTGVRRRSRDRQAIADLTGRTIRLLRRFRAEAAATAQRYRDEADELASPQTWDRLFTE